MTVEIIVMRKCAEINARIMTMDTQMWMEMAVMLTMGVVVEIMMTMILIQWPCVASVAEETEQKKQEEKREQQQNKYDGNIKEVTNTRPLERKDNNMPNGLTKIEYFIFT